MTEIRNIKLRESRKEFEKYLTRGVPGGHGAGPAPPAPRSQPEFPNPPTRPLRSFSASLDASARYADAPSRFAADRVTDNAAGGGSGASETRGGAVPLVCGGDFRNRCHKRGSMESRALCSTFVKDKGKRYMIQKEKTLKIMCHEKRKCLPRPRPLPAPRIRARSLIPNPSSKSLFALHRRRGAT